MANVSNLAGNPMSVVMIHALDQGVSILKYNLMDTWHRKSILYTYLTHTLNGHKCGYSEYVMSM